MAAGMFYKEWVETFSQWGSEKQQEALDELVHVMSSDVSNGAMRLSTLSASIDPLLRRDFISGLPPEMASHVLSFLPPRDLYVVGMVSREWRRVTRHSDALWQTLCERVETAECLQDPTSPIAGRVLAEIKRQLAMSHGPGPISPIDVYAAWNKLKAAWRSPGGFVPHTSHVVTHRRKVITCMTWTEDFHVVTGSNDNTLKLWDPHHTRKPGGAGAGSAHRDSPLLDFVGHTMGVWSCAAWKQYMVSGSCDHTLKVWCLSTNRAAGPAARTGEGVCLHTLHGHTQTVRCLSLVGGRVVSGSRDQTVRVWDVVTGECLHDFRGHHNAVRCIEFDGRYVVSGSYDFNIRVWDTMGNESSACLRTLSGHEEKIYSLKFDSKRIVSGSMDKTIKVWDFETGAVQHTLRGHTSLTSLMVLKDDILVSANADKTVRVWDLTRGTCRATLTDHSSAVTHVSIFMDAIISCSDDGTVKLWDLHTGELIRDIISLNPGNGHPTQMAIWRFAETPCYLALAAGVVSEAHQTEDSTRLCFMDWTSVFNSAPAAPTAPGTGRARLKKSGPLTPPEGRSPAVSPLAHGAAAPAPAVTPDAPVAASASAALLAALSQAAVGDAGLQAALPHGGAPAPP